MHLSSRDGKGGRMALEKTTALVSIFEAVIITGVAVFGVFESFRDQETDAGAQGDITLDLSQTVDAIDSMEAALSTEMGELQLRLARLEQSLDQLRVTPSSQPTVGSVQDPSAGQDRAETTRPSGEGSTELGESADSRAMETGSGQDEVAESRNEAVASCRDGLGAVERLRIIVGGLNVRVGPPGLFGSLAAPTGRIVSNNEVVVVQASEGAGIGGFGTTWYQVKACDALGKEFTGWISSRLAGGDPTVEAVPDLVTQD